MKRSREVQVPLLIASLGTLVAGCDQSPQPKQPEVQEPPAYMSRTECEAKHGGNNACDEKPSTHPGGGFVYYPHLYNSGGYPYYYDSPARAGASSNTVIVRPSMSAPSMGGGAPVGAVARGVFGSTGAAAFGGGS